MVSILILTLASFTSPPIDDKWEGEFTIISVHSGMAFDIKDARKDAGLP